MSQTPHKTIEIVDLPMEAYYAVGCDPQQSTQHSASQKRPEFVDPDDPGGLWNMYLRVADTEDESVVGHWKADTDGILIFSGLFSVALATLVAVSIHDVRPDNSAFYLANIYEVLAADTNGSNVVVPRALANPSSAFSPPKYAVWVNTLWFLSLVLSLTCALLATLLQHWVRRYVKITRLRHAPHKRARIRAFFAEGLVKLRITWAVEALPVLLHVAFSLFFAGLVIFLFKTDLTAFKFVISWIGFCAIIYTFLTFMPIFRHDSPYSTPLSSLVWLLYTGLLYVVFRSLRWFTAFNCFNHAMWVRFHALRDHYYGRFSFGMEKAAEEFALKLPPDIDGRALIRTLEALDEDDELEKFFAGIPSFCRSAVGSYQHGAFKASNGEKMSDALVGFMCRTLTSDLIPESIKQCRLEICSKAINTASLPISRRTFDRILYRDWSGLLNSVDFGLFLKRIAYQDPFSDYYSQCVVSVIVATAQERDARWFELAMSQLGVSRYVLQSYLDHGDSLLLANCISMCQRTIHAYSEHGWDRDVYSQSKTLKTVSILDIRTTLPELRNDFCKLWNQIAVSAQDSSDRRIRMLATNILFHIRSIYITLHEGTSAAPVNFSNSTADIDPILMLPSSYPLCNIQSHSTDLPPQFYTTATGATELTGQPPRTVLQTVSYHDVPPGSVPGTPLILMTDPGHLGTHHAEEGSPGFIIHVNPELPRDASRPHSAGDTRSALVSTFSTSVSLSSSNVASKNIEYLSPPIALPPGNVIRMDPGSSTAPGPLVSQHEHTHTRAVSLASASSVSLPFTAPYATSAVDLNVVENKSEAASRRIHHSPSTKSVASLIVVTTSSPR